MFNKHVRSFLFVALFISNLFSFCKEVTNAQELNNNEESTFLNSIITENKTDNTLVLKLDPRESEVGYSEDPRRSECSKKEIDEIQTFFNNPQACEAYSCIDKIYLYFIEKLSEHYTLSSDELKNAAKALAACYCRCGMMECEVQFVHGKLSDKCKEGTSKYCMRQNRSFVDACTRIADKYSKVYDLDVDEAGFKSLCRVCSEKYLFDPSSSKVSNRSKRETSETPETVGGSLINKIEDSDVISNNVTPREMGENNSGDSGKASNSDSEGTDLNTKLGEKEKSDAGEKAGEKDQPRDDDGGATGSHGKGDDATSDSHGGKAGDHPSSATSARSSLYINNFLFFSYVCIIFISFAYYLF